jgi:hypothetical protein
LKFYVNFTPKITPDFTPNCCLFAAYFPPTEPLFPNFIALLPLFIKIHKITEYEKKPLNKGFFSFL